MIQKSGKILCLLVGLAAVPSFGAAPADVQCYWDQDPVVVTLGMPASTDCRVMQGTQFQYDLLCLVPFTVVIGNLSYSSGTNIIVGHNNDSQSLQEYFTKGFSIFNFIPVELWDATGFAMSLTMSPTTDGKSLVPSTMTVPNVAQPCAVSWAPPLIIHPNPPIVH